MKDADKELLDDLATLNHYQKIKIEVYEEIMKKYQKKQVYYLWHRKCIQTGRRINELCECIWSYSEAV